MLETTPPAIEPRRARGVCYWHAAVVWFVVMLPLAWWGLPSRANDDLLFGGEPAWPAERFGAAHEALRAIEQRRGGADTDLDPLGQQDEIVDLTTDDDARAAILLRFRLYTRQPDEMITIRALARMKPRELDLDPRLYQYAGGYIYLFGASVAAAAVTGFVPLTRDLGVYLTQPEQIARVYLVGRFLSLVFGALALIALARLAERSAGRTAGWLALVFAALSPVFICGALEAKPHLPSVCLTLWATLAALRLVPAPRAAERGLAPAALIRSGASDAKAPDGAAPAPVAGNSSGASSPGDEPGAKPVRLGLLAGGAAALVLTGISAALLWPALMLARRSFRTVPRVPRGETPPASGAADARTASESISYAVRSAPQRRSKALWLAGAVAVVTFCVLNPYLLYNLLFNRESLGSNLSNSTAMYRVGRVGEGAATVLELLVESVGAGVLVLGIVAGAVGAARRWREAVVTTAPALGMVVLCALIGAGKPGEFARFLLLPALLLCVGAAAATVWLAQRRTWWGLVAAALVVLSMSTFRYIRAFAADARGVNESRRQAAEFLRAEMQPGDVVGLLDEPAPYATPPLDLTRTTLALLPREFAAHDAKQALPRWVVYVSDSASARRDGWWSTAYERVAVFPNAGEGVRIAWANKVVQVLRRRGE